jgi:riboflavin synthase
VDGVSLTIAAVHAGSFEVALIPTTLSLTTLGSRKPGYEFNLETDILAKTVVFWLEQQEL